MSRHGESILYKYLGTQGTLAHIQLRAPALGLFQKVNQMFASLGELQACHIGAQF